MVGQRQGRHLVGFRLIHQTLYAGGPVENRILGMDMQVCKRYHACKINDSGRWAQGLLISFPGEGYRVNGPHPIEQEPVPDGRAFLTEGDLGGDPVTDHLELLFGGMELLSEVEQV